MATPSRIAWNRAVAADAVELATTSAINPGPFAPVWVIRVLGNATTPSNGLCTFSDGSTLTFAASATPTTAQFGVTNPGTGVIRLTDGTTAHALNFLDATRVCATFNSNTSQGLIPCVASSTAARLDITLCTGAAGATATDPTGTAWTLTVIGYSSLAAA